MAHRSDHSASTDRAENTGLTIGFLTPHIGGDGLGERVWDGVTAAAQHYGVNIICFVGGELRSHREFMDQANVLYDLANSTNIDGLILWGSSLRNFIGAEALAEFCERFSPLPIVELDEIPASVTESYDYRGMYLTMEHLLDVHGCRRVAFIPGAAGNSVTQYRYNAYVDALAAYGLPFDPQLVAPSDYWDEASGRRLVRVLLDQRRATFDAIAAANDRLAIGAIEALQEWGIRVPYDVAVVGFDDNPDGHYITPPLTTVPYPTKAMGQRAVKTILRLLQQQVPDDDTAILPTLVIRQSCGCVNPAVKQAGVRPVAQPHSTEGIQSVIAEKETILAEILLSLKEPAFQEWAALVFEALLKELSEPSSEVFLVTLDDILGRVAAINSDVAGWQNAISILRQQILSRIHDGALRLRIENLLGQARVLIGEASRRHRGFRHLRAEQQMDRLHHIGAQLLSTFDVQALLEILAHKLPDLHIPTCYLALYDNPEQPLEWSRLIMAHHERGPIDLPREGIRFRSDRILPQEFWPETTRFTMIVESLYHHQDQLGFIVFQDGPADGSVYATLRDLLSSALQGALLVQQVQAHSEDLARSNAELARNQYILDAFMKNVPDSIYFKDRESRIIRANQALARRIGLSDPSEAIGKTDFDFFSEPEARLRYTQEQRIIQSGQPSIDSEEHRRREGRDSWTLSTKMPLRDEYGDIIGTFGISRDITVLKEAQASLERAYDEIMTLNNQLKEENLRNYLKASLLSTPFESSLTGIGTLVKESWTAPWLSIVLFKFLFPNSTNAEIPGVCEKSIAFLRQEYERYSQSQPVAGMFHQLSDREVVLILNVKEPSQIYSLCAFLEAQSHALTEDCEANLAIGVGKAVSDLEELHNSYTIAQQALSARQGASKTQILTPEDAEQANQEALLFWFPREQESQLIAAMTVGHEANVTACLRRIFQKNALEEARYQKAVAVYDRCLRVLSRILAQHPLPETILQEDMLIRLFRAEKPETLPELQSHLLSMFQQMAGHYHQFHQQRSDVLLQKLLRYLEQHYADPNLSLTSLSEVFQLTPSYISEYFKERTGLKYIEYLATLRITRAKELLLTAPDLKISEICSRVGFMNPETFIRAFKRLEGISPGKFRKHALSG